MHLYTKFQVSASTRFGDMLTRANYQIHCSALWRACCYFIILSVVFPDGDRSLLVSPSDLLVC